MLISLRVGLRHGTNRWWEERDTDVSTIRWSKNFLHLTWTGNSHINMFLYLKKCILTLFNEKVKKQKPTAISTSSIQTIVFKYHFILKEARTAWRNGWFQGWSKCYTKWAGNILSQQEPKYKTKQKIYQRLLEYVQKT